VKIFDPNSDGLPGPQRRRDQMAERVLARLNQAPDDDAHRKRRLRAWHFQVLVLVVAVAFGVLAVVAYSVPYFAIDLTLTRAIQSIQAPWFGLLLDKLSWIGFPPQSNVIFGLVILALFLVGLRLEALATAFAAVGSAALWFALAPVVQRPRPSPDLINVSQQIPWGSFPSGHALNLTAIFGFLVYLVYVHIRSGWLRRLVMTLLALPILTIGLARVYAGAHWPSDVLGGYLLGLLWLALTIHLYRWAWQRLSQRQRQGALPTAPAT
jgi:undecaprenyl-diphosphatase